MTQEAKIIEAVAVAGGIVNGATLGGFNGRVIVATIPTAGGGGGGEDTVAPVVTPITPGGQLLEVDGSRVFDVTDDVGLGRIFVVARFTSLGIAEVVAIDGVFEPIYSAAGSARSIISQGFRYTLFRAGGGWPADSTVEFEVFPFDTSGNEG